MKTRTSILAAVMAAVLALAGTSCETSGGFDPVVSVGSSYLADKYLEKADTAAEWQERHTVLSQLTAGIESLNQNGITPEGVQALAAPFLKSENAETRAVVRLLVAYLPKQAVGPNYPTVTALTTSLRSTLAWGNPHTPAK